jgi:elongation factor 1-beta
MGRVSVTMRVMPTEADVDMQALRDAVVAAIPGYAKITGTEEKPIAFGLKALMVQVIMPDQSPDEMLDVVAGVPNVENVEVEELTLI